MDSVKDTMASVSQAVTGSNQSGTEPPSGVSGAGTADQPYDQGNATAQATAPGEEPVSGQQGKGTVDEPYDQGNQPEQPEGASTTQIPIHPSPKDPSNSQMEPTAEQQKVLDESRGRDESSQHTTSTPEPEGQSTKTTSDSGNFGAATRGVGEDASRMKYEERDVSPGEMRDGTHVVTSGQKGEGYQPSKLNKLKDKFSIGRNR